MVDRTKAGSPSLVFRCTADKDCVLTGIRTWDGAIAYNPGHKSAHDKEASFISVPLRPVNAD
jgi:hypothetical protein